MKNLFKSCLLLLVLGSTQAIKAQVPALSSYPSAAATIFLDFDGHTVTGTSWNASGPLQCGSSGLDNTKINEIFNRVAEDYRPFNINITTDSTKYLAAPVKQRMRVIVTTSSSWYGSAGGVAFVTSFKWGDDTPCFVFSALLGYHTKNISEAIAHEAGHTLGLYHQAVYDANCVKTSDYNSGIGSGEIGWAPIMGVGYYRNFTLWNLGPNSMGCNNVQSDLDIITAAGNDFGYRTDDHSNATASATLANFTSNQFTLNGVIERNTDQDLFKFIMPAEGRFELEATPYNVGTGNSGSDLDMQVTLMNSSQTILNVYNPGTLLSSLVDTLLNGGTYYIKVEGKGNLYAPSYASLGSYALLGKFSSGGTLPLHKLELKGSTSGDRHKLDWEVIADEQIIDQVIEIATDGRTFKPLTQAGNDARTYTYRPATPGAAQYRVKVSFDNGRTYYSNVVYIKAGAVPRPQLIGNVVGGSTIMIASPGNFSYMIYDMNGRTISKGQLTNGVASLPASGLVNGVYMIRFADNEQQWTDKFIRQ